MDPSSLVLTVLSVGYDVLQLVRASATVSKHRKDEFGACGDSIEALLGAIKEAGEACDELKDYIVLDHHGVFDSKAAKRIDALVGSTTTIASVVASDDSVRELSSKGVKPLLEHATKLNDVFRPRQSVLSSPDAAAETPTRSTGPRLISSASVASIGGSQRLAGATALGESVGAPVAPSNSRERAVRKILASSKLGTSSQRKPSVQIAAAVLTSLSLCAGACMSWLESKDQRSKSFIGRTGLGGASRVKEDERAISEATVRVDEARANLQLLLQLAIVQVVTDRKLGNAALTDEAPVSEKEDEEVAARLAEVQAALERRGWVDLRPIQGRMEEMHASFQEVSRQSKILHSSQWKHVQVDEVSVGVPEGRTTVEREQVLVDILSTMSAMGGVPRSASRRSFSSPSAMAAAAAVSSASPMTTSPTTTAAASGRKKKGSLKSWDQWMTKFKSIALSCPRRLVLLRGAEGAGKTEAAREFVGRCREALTHRWVAWVDASGLETMLDGLRAASAAVGASDDRSVTALWSLLLDLAKGDAERGIERGILKDAANRGDRMLLVLDGLDDPRALLRDLEQRVSAGVTQTHWIPPVDAAVDVVVTCQEESIEGFEELLHACDGLEVESELLQVDIDKLSDAESEAMFRLVLDELSKHRGVSVALPDGSRVGEGEPWLDLDRLPEWDGNGWHIVADAACLVHYRHLPGSALVPGPASESLLARALVERHLKVVEAVCKRPLTLPAPFFQERFSELSRCATVESVGEVASKLVGEDVESAFKGERGTLLAIVQDLAVRSIKRWDPPVMGIRRLLLARLLVACSLLAQVVQGAKRPPRGSPSLESFLRCTVEETTLSLHLHKLVAGLVGMSERGGSATDPGDVELNDAGARFLRAIAGGLALTVRETRVVLPLEWWRWAPEESAEVEGRVRREVEERTTSDPSLLSALDLTLWVEGVAYSAVQAVSDWTVRRREWLPVLVDLRADQVQLHHCGFLADDGGVPRHPIDQGTVFPCVVMDGLGWSRGGRGEGYVLEALRAVTRVGEDGLAGSRKVVAPVLYSSRVEDEAGRRGVAGRLERGGFIPVATHDACRRNAPWASPALAQWLEEHERRMLWSPGWSAAPGLEQVRQEVRAWAFERFSRFQWLFEPSPVRTEDVYTPAVVLSSADQEPVAALASSRRQLVRGCEGSGKSTLARWLMLEWSKGAIEAPLAVLVSDADDGEVALRLAEDVGLDPTEVERALSGDSTLWVLDGASAVERFSSQPRWVAFVASSAEPQERSVKGAERLELMGFDGEDALARGAAMSAVLASPRFEAPKAEELLMASVIGHSAASAAASALPSVEGVVGHVQKDLELSRVCHLPLAARLVGFAWEQGTLRRGGTLSDVVRSALSAVKAKTGKLEWEELLLLLGRFALASLEGGLFAASIAAHEDDLARRRAAAQAKKEEAVSYSEQVSSIAASVKEERGWEALEGMDWAVLARRSGLVVGDRFASEVFCSWFAAQAVVEQIERHELSPEWFSKRKLLPRFQSVWRFVAEAASPAVAERLLQALLHRPWAPVASLQEWYRLGVCLRGFKEPASLSKRGELCRVWSTELRDAVVRGDGRWVDVVGRTVALWGMRCVDSELVQWLGEVADKHDDQDARTNAKAALTILGAYSAADSVLDPRRLPKGWMRTALTRIVGAGRLLASEWLQDEDPPAESYRVVSSPMPRARDIENVWFSPLDRDGAASSRALAFVRRFVEARRRIVLTEDDVRARQEDLASIRGEFESMTRPTAEAIARAYHKCREGGDLASVIRGLRADRSLELVGGGYAGGIRVWDSALGAFFKIAEDLNRLFRGSDVMAHKSSSRELAAMGFVNDVFDSMHVTAPLSASVDVTVRHGETGEVERVYRVVACNLLPLNERSLQLGSEDGGRTIHVAEGMLEPMKALASALHLAPRRLEDSQPVVIHRACVEQRPSSPDRLSEDLRKSLKGRLEALGCGEASSGPCGRLEGELDVVVNPFRVQTVRWEAETTRVGDALEGGRWPAGCVKDGHAVIPLPFDVEGHMLESGERCILDCQRLLIPECQSSASARVLVVVPHTEEEEPTIVEEGSSAMDLATETLESKGDAVVSVHPTEIGLTVVEGSSHTVIVADPREHWRSEPLTAVFPPSAGGVLRELGGAKVCPDDALGDAGASTGARRRLESATVTLLGEENVGECAFAILGAVRAGGSALNAEERRKRIKGCLHKRGLGLRHVTNVWGAVLERSDDDRELQREAERWMVSACFPRAGSAGGGALERLLRGGKVGKFPKALTCARAMASKGWNCSAAQTIRMGKAMLEHEEVATEWWERQRGATVSAKSSGGGAPPPATAHRGEMAAKWRDGMLRELAHRQHHSGSEGSREVLQRLVQLGRRDAISRVEGELAGLRRVSESDASSGGRDLTDALGELAEYYRQSAMLQEALSVARECLRVQEQRLGKDHAETKAAAALVATLKTELPQPMGCRCTVM
jgi:hypothetical protein